MHTNNSKDIHLLLITAVVLLFSVGIYLANSFGMLAFGKGDYVTVMGTSKTTQGNQIATFTAGISTLNSDKNAAVAEMTRKSTEILAAVKNFGIPDADIKTDNINIYQDQTYDQTEQKYVLGDWRATESVEIKLRDITKATDLTTLLSSISDSLYGPNFAVDSKSTDESSLLVGALVDARAKADAVAKASGKKLGNMTNFFEGTAANNSLTPVYSAGGMGGGAPIVVPGSTDITKTVTVTYRLR
jgi:uncharacterized protein YggE